MKYSVAMTDELDGQLRRHLVREDGQEDLCFAVWFPSRGRTRLTILLHHLVLPNRGDRIVHGNAEFLPSYFERALQAALDAGGGVAFLHSHPASGWQGMSGPDLEAETGMAAAVLAATGFPLAGLTIAAVDGTWSARVWERVGTRKYKRFWCQSVRVIGQRLKVDYCYRLLPPPPHRTSQSRTVSAWGPVTQARLARLRVGVVGLGSVGGVVSEALARTGFQRVQLLDFDALIEENLDRTLHATSADVRRQRSKVVVVGKGLRRSATARGFRADAEEFSVCEEDGYRRALDCDVLFSCVDRPWPRSVLNFIAYAHLIPVIDGGVLVSRSKSGQWRGADWKAHTVTFGHRCLRCLRQYEPGLVTAEKEGHLDDPTYIESLPDDHPLRVNENVFAFGLATASLELLQLIMLAAGPCDIGPPGPQNYHLVTGKIDIGEFACDNGCPFPSLASKGEMAGPAGTGSHPTAERARNLRAPRSEIVA